mmetsp:Transcript_13985/g.37599  ORF Transcript_13985/g.37599 Transcript_13985/m.37599 type:complete len:210 (+) Transcript_13985:728-1357(+)
MQRAHLGGHDNRLRAAVRCDDLVVLREDGALVATSKQDLSAGVDGHQICVALRVHPGLQGKVPVPLPPPDRRGARRVLHPVQVPHGPAPDAPRAVARGRLRGVSGLRHEDPTDGDRRRACGLERALGHLELVGRREWVLRDGANVSVRRGVDDDVPGGRQVLFGVGQHLLRELGRQGVALAFHNERSRARHQTRRDGQHNRHHRPNRVN